MDSIDNDILISLVESRPVLWDKTIDIYKDRVATRKAWDEVCQGLKEDYDSISDSEKNVFGKEVIRRWTNLRDYYARCKRDERTTKKKGSEAKKRKKYVFSDQLKFLDKVYHNTVPMDSLDSETEPALDNSVEDNGESGGPGAGDPSISMATNNLKISSEHSSSRSKKRKQKSLDEVELKMLNALEPKAPCSKMSFLQSLLLHLNKYTDSEFLQFQMAVLNVIENINKAKETSSHPQTNFPFAMPPQQVSQYMYNSPALIQEQAFLNSQQTSFPPRQFLGPSFSSNFPSLAQQLSSPIHSYRQQNRKRRQQSNSNSGHQINKSTPQKNENQTSQYLRGSGNSNSAHKSQKNEDQSTSQYLRGSGNSNSAHKSQKNEDQTTSKYLRGSGNSNSSHTSQKNEDQTTSQYLQGSGNSNSSHSEDFGSTAISPSGESIYSD